MTAVSFTALSVPVPMPVPSAPRVGDGVVAEVKGGFPASAEAKPVAQTVSRPAGAKASTTAADKTELANQVRELQVKMDKLNPALAFVVDQTSGRALIQLTDRDTNEVIQQFPSAAAIQISKALDRFQKGQLVNKVV
jgi:uncharacterized FlaG/YvyC family protein